MVLITFNQRIKKIFRSVSTQRNTESQPLLGLTGIWIEFPEDWHWEGNRYGLMKHNIYGTPQSAELFYAMMSKLLQVAGFTRNEAEPTLFTLFLADFIMLILTHVDNFNVGSSDPKRCKYILENLHPKVKITKQKTSSVLGITVIQSPDRTVITFDMVAYIEGLKEKFLQSEENFSKVNIPISPTTVAKHLLYKKGVLKNQKLDTSIDYMSLVMSLMWLARCYRYDIMFAVIFFSTFSHCYNQELYN